MHPKCLKHLTLFKTQNHNLNALVTSFNKSNTLFKRGLPSSPFLSSKAHLVLLPNPHVFGHLMNLSNGEDFDHIVFALTLPYIWFGTWEMAMNVDNRFAFLPIFEALFLPLQKKKTNVQVFVFKMDKERVYPNSYPHVVHWC